MQQPGNPPPYGAPPPQGYAAPPPQGYAAPPPQGYGHPPTQPMYPQPQYVPQPAPMSQMQSSSNVVVVNSQPAAPTVIHTHTRPHTNHLLHLIISIFFFPWIIVWICICLCNGCE